MGLSTFLLIIATFMPVYLFILTGILLRWVLVR